MKRVLIFLLVFLMLSGCTFQNPGNDDSGETGADEELLLEYPLDTDIPMKFQSEEGEINVTVRCSVMSDSEAVKAEAGPLFQAMDGGEKLLEEDLYWISAAVTIRPGEDPRDQEHLFDAARHVEFSFADIGEVNGGKGAPETMMTTVGDDRGSILLFRTATDYRSYQIIYYGCVPPETEKAIKISVAECPYSHPRDFVPPSPPDKRIRTFVYDTGKK